MCSSCPGQGRFRCGVGLLAGVATATRAQGHGLGKRVTATALTALIRDYGTAALMVEADNTAARSLYGSLGMTYRPVRAAALQAPGPYRVRELCSPVGLPGLAHHRGEGLTPLRDDGLIHSVIGKGCYVSGT